MIKRFTYAVSSRMAITQAQTLFTESEIIKLQNIFLTPGFHTLQVRNAYESRQTIETFLSSLNCYANIACLSMADAPIPSKYFDIFYALTFGGYINSTCQTSLEHFFLEHFDADFLWIEATPMLLAQPWFYEFKYHLDRHNIRNLLPVVTLQELAE